MPEPLDDDALLTTGQAAAWLGVDANTVRRSTTLLPDRYVGQREGRGDRRYRGADVKAELERMRSGGRPTID